MIFSWYIAWLWLPRFTISSHRGYLFVRAKASSWVSLVLGATSCIPLRYFDLKIFSILLEDISIPDIYRTLRYRSGLSIFDRSFSSLTSDDIVKPSVRNLLAFSVIALIFWMTYFDLVVTLLNVNSSNALNFEIA